uniref:telomere repeats-binding bouquet formation protein 2 n=1 Tax=Myxine glutinosa TaxID=7769 RepID=UPI00358F0165
MFNKRKAWFSTSVDKTICDIWVRERGVLGNPNDSEYIFSANAESSDTVRIYNSEKYLNGGVTVFHASFVAACVRSQNTAIGHYVLPPAELHEAFQERIGPFIWENSKATQHLQDVNQQSLKTSRQGIKRRLRETNTSRHEANRRISLDDSGTDITHQENNINVNEICPAERNGNDIEPMPVDSCCQIKQHNHQVNNFLTSHLHVSKMQKYTGPLSDFSPGLAGYRVLRGNN